ncbi:SH3 domain-containing protein [Streptomyces sp. NPDC055078]
MALDKTRPEIIDAAATEAAAEAPAETTGAPAGATAEASTGSSTGTSTEASADAIATAATRYPVAPGYRLNVRSGPGTGYRLVRVLPLGARVPINCQQPGEWIAGPYGTTNLWDNIASGEFVSDAYVLTGSDGYVTVRCS